MTLNQRAIALLRELVTSFPQFGTDEPINGADAVDIIGVLVGKAKDLLSDSAKQKRKQSTGQARVITRGKKHV